MSSEGRGNIVIKCGNCHKKFTITVSAANPTITIYRGHAPSTKPVESRANNKMRLLKTCPYCGAENEIYLTTRSYTVHLDDPEDAKRIIEEIAGTKQRWVVRGLRLLMGSFVLLFLNISLFLGMR